MTVFKLPDLGEGLPDAEIREWYVKVGDEVTIDQPLVSMETAKAVVDVPAPYSGVVKKLYGEFGDVIDTGEPLIEFEAKASQREDTGTVAGQIEVGEEIVEETAMVLTRPRGTNTAQAIKTTPAVRSLAQRLGVDLTEITGTGTNGLITANDVKNAKSPISSNAVVAGEKLKGTRRIMAQAMAASHQEVVPVTLFDEACIAHWKNQDITHRLIRALVSAVQAEPALNAHFDGKAQSRQLFDQVQLGLAMDSEEGLFVPVIANAEQYHNDSKALRDQIEHVKSQVKTRSIDQENLAGATITLSNFGMFAGAYATPIVVPPQVAILGVGKITTKPIVIDNQLAVGKVAPLSLTFDHRAVTGGEATRFMAAVIEDLMKSC